MEKDIEKAIRETIVIKNKEGLKYAVKRVFSVISSRLSELEEENRLLKLTLKNGLGTEGPENGCL